MRCWVHPGVRRASVVLVIVCGALFAGAGVSTAAPDQGPGVPPSGSPAPPPNPSDQQLQRSKQDIASSTAQVGRLTGQLAAAQARADQLGDKLEVRRELANKAMIDLAGARAQAVAAFAKAQAAHTETLAAGSAEQDARRRVDQFVAAAYQQGLVSGSLGLLAQASDPDELISRAQLTQALADEQRGALDTARRAQIAKVNADSLARAADLQAQQSKDRAQRAKQAADGAMAAASAAVAQGVSQLRAVDAERAGIEHQLDTLTAHDADLRGQRQRYLTYQRQVAAAAQASSAAASARVASSVPVSATSPGAAQAVIDRALAKIGVSYAWGGGNSGGATKGIHDGGEADAYGDFRKTGFDCSGLMIYAFGAVGIGLPHYSGYQYDSGKKVPVSQIRPGDLLFWADSGTIHHVALYIGDGKMVEAPYSGGKVRITPVRYGDGLLPNAVRLL